MRGWSARNRQRKREIERKSGAKYRETHPEVQMRRGAKARAKKSGVPFSLERADISIPKVCPVLGIPLRRNTGSLSDDSPSLDRIVPAAGYVKGNVVVISMRANRIKSDASVEELRKLARFYSKLTKK